MAEAPARKVIQAPPWLVRLATPMIARFVARDLARKYPGEDPAQVLARMRADLGRELDAGELRLLAAVRARLPAQGDMGAAQGGAAVTWKSPSSLALVAANLVALWGVLVWGWPVFPVLLLFWLENVVVGVLNVLRMLLVDPGDLPLWASKLFMVPFFCVHYGMFTAIHGVFVVSLFGGKEYDRMVHGLWTLDAAARAVRDFDLGLPLGALVLSHLFSFCWNYLLHGEYRRASLPDLMGRPYDRVVVLHVTILLGGFAAMALGSPLWALFLLVAVKIGVDLAAHVKERGKFESA